jgi:predicted dehydrogenase
LQSLEQTFEIVAVYSRSPGPAQALAERLPGPVKPYTDLAALLARDDIEAVDLVLPIPVMPAVVESALRAGKHVISEKPIAPDLTTGRRLLSTYAGCTGQVWLVGENWRYEAAFEQAAHVVHSGQLGRPLLCHWTVYNPIQPDNKYYATSWRRAGGYPGGFALDVGVHHIAVLRWLLGEIAAVSATTTQVRADLPPPDTLSATLRFENGAMGTYLATYATSALWPPALHLSGEFGSLRVHRQELEVTLNGVTQPIPITPYGGVVAQLAAFAAAIRQGQRHRNPPEQALQDVAVIEAMLRSAETGCQVAPERIVGNRE